MDLVEGALKSLQKLAVQHNIIILSNIPFKFYEKRKVALKKYGMNFPFFAIYTALRAALNLKRNFSTIFFWYNFKYFEAEEALFL